MKETESHSSRRRIISAVTAVLAVLFIAVSVSFALYPTVSKLINNIANRNRNTEYTSTVKTLTEKEKAEILKQAENYNIQLNSPSRNDSVFAYKDSADYTEVLNFADGQMGTVVIPKINVNLPIYHGTGEDMLSQGAVHLPNTSLPIGGIGTHSCISAHTAYPAKTFFDKLDRLEIGDRFYIQILDDTNTYQVTDINIVNPTDTSLLQIDYSKDLTTLITCYPYAINSHRLLVRGERIPDTDNKASQEIRSVQENYTEEKTLIAIGAAVIAVVLLTVVFAMMIRRRKKKKGVETNE